MARMIDAWHDRYHNADTRDYGCPHCQDEIMTDTRKYGTNNPVLTEARLNHDPYDEFAWVQDWRFAIVDRLYFVEGEDVPQFNPGGATSPEFTFAYEMLSDLDPSVEDMTYALKILDRFRNWLSIAGEDY